MTTLLVRDGLVVTQDDHRRILRGDVLVEDDRIAAMGEDAGHGVDADRVVDAAGCAVVPGLVNAHTHVAMTLLRGYGDDMELEPWLEERIWPAEANLTAETTRAGGLLGMLEMVASGTTTFADMYFFEDAIAEAVDEVGLRGVLGFTFIDHATPEMTPEDQAREARAFFDRWRDHPRVVPSLAPHGTYTCGPETLTTVAELRDELDAPPVQVHCSETRTEVYDVEAEHGRRPVAQLAAHDLLRPTTLLAHCGWITKEEARAIARAGASVSHNPVANLKLATGGVTPVPELLEAGATVALGTDGPASNNTLDLWDTMKTAALVQKQHRWDASVLPAGTVLDMATRGGAEALGLGDDLGSIEPGKRADLVLVDLQRPGLQPLHDVVSQLVYAARGPDVRTTIVEGEVLYEDGAFTKVDAEKVMEEAREGAAGIVKG